MFIHLLAVLDKNKNTTIEDIPLSLNDRNLTALIHPEDDNEEAEHRFLLVEQKLVHLIPERFDVSNYTIAVYGQDTKTALPFRNMVNLLSLDDLKEEPLFDRKEIQVIGTNAFLDEADRIASYVTVLETEETIEEATDPFTLLSDNTKDPFSVVDLTILSTNGLKLMKRSYKK